MDNDILKRLLEQISEQNKIIKWCQTLLTIAVITCVIAIVIMLFIIFKGQGQFSRDKVIIGDIKDKDELHREVIELKKIIKELQSNSKLKI